MTLALREGLLYGSSETLDPQQVKSLRNLVGAADPEPTLTLQPVINQRRAAKPTNEFRPAPRTQQAWTGGGDEGRELRASGGRAHGLHQQRASTLLHRQPMR